MLEYPNSRLRLYPHVSPALPGGVHQQRYAHADFPGSAGSKERIGQTADLLRSHAPAVVAYRYGKQVFCRRLIHGQCHPGRPGAYRILDYVQYVH